jgi:beta-lactamase superfamily II metal-dependent hydrolase
MTEIFRITMLPAQDGDSLLVELGPASSPFRMLIDGGRSRAVGAIRTLLAGLPPRATPLVDVLVLTHVDADHIEGLLEVLDTDADAGRLFGDVWFNGRKHMLAAKGIVLKPSVAPAAAAAPTPRVAVLSIGQGLEFSELIDRQKLKWNAAFAGKPVMTRPDQPLPVVAIAAGATLTVLGPPVGKLKKFEADWAKAFDAAAREAEPTLRTAAPRDKVTAANLRALARELDRPDTAKPNGSSIAFAIHYKGKSALFAGDAHPDDLARALKRFAADGKRAVFSVVKASHHGSARNNTSELMTALGAERWLISTDGSRHQHPDPEGIARIVLNAPAGELVFNYRSSFNEDWSDPALQTAFGFTARHMGEGENYTLDLLA